MHDGLDRFVGRASVEGDETGLSKSANEELS